MKILSAIVLVVAVAVVASIIIGIIVIIKIKSYLYGDNTTEVANDERQ